MCDPENGLASRILDFARPRVEEIELPPGYRLEWWGEYKNSTEAKAALAGGMPLFLLLMIVTVIALFNSLRQTLVIWLTVPLGDHRRLPIGLLATGLPFNFLALLGFLSLIGHDHQELHRAHGRDQSSRSVRGRVRLQRRSSSSGTSRLRPVSMAAASPRCWAWRPCSPTHSSKPWR